ncbi:MAG: trimethylamine methyltransferase family protein, partial [Anaerolineales bacterium]|nr:trimethylamine methyltransferase family protein [Anaerolineales bacterium]
MANIDPIQPKLRINILSDDQLAEVKSATLHILEAVGVRFPCKRALNVFAEHGAQVDMDKQLVRLSPALVLEAMSCAPRTYDLSGRVPGSDLHLDGKRSYFCTDACGTLTLDFENGQQRPSCKQDVARMALVADYLDSVSFYWPMVSAQDFGLLAPLHELQASFANTGKHVQTVTVTKPALAGHAIRMAEVIAGDSQAMRSKPPVSFLICTVAPLGQDKESIEAAMLFAEAGLPVGFMSMPNLGSTSPATMGGALAMGDAEIVSAITLMQLVAPGAPVFHSLLASVMDPRSADYLTTLPQKYLCNAAAVQLAHEWGVPSLAGAFGADHTEPATWVLGRDSVYTSLLTPLAGADMVTAFGLLRASTLLVPEQIIFDDETYHTNRLIAAGIDVSPEALA